MQKGQAPVLILVGILIIIAVAGGAYYFGKSQTPKPTTTFDEIANWKTYTNKEYGYSFKAPPDWETSVQAANAIILTSPDFQDKSTGPGGTYYILKGSKLTVAKAIGGFKTLEQAVEVNSNGKALIVGYTTVAGLKAVKFTHHCCESQTNHLVISVLKNGEEFIIQQEYSLDGENPYPNLLDQVAATFKFTQ